MIGNIHLVAYAIYILDKMPLHRNSVYIGSPISNQDEYNANIGLFIIATHLFISHMDSFIDSQHVIAQLNKTLQIGDPLLFHMYQHVKLLVWIFNNFTFSHNPRHKNHVTNKIENGILD